MLFLTLILAFQTGTGQEFTLGAGDVLEVQVLNLEEVNGEYQVDNLGTITLPYLNQLQVRNMTTRELQSLIADRLADKYLNNPQVIVKVKQQRSRPVSVIGAVTRPGQITFTYDIDLLHVLSQVGGVTENAGDKLLVIRKSGSGVGATLEINLHKLLYEGLPHLNIPIFPGDTINVPLDIPFSVYVTGEVVKPGELKFSRRDRVTLLQVIAKAGGMTDYARAKKVVVKRESEGIFTEFKLNVKDIKSGKEPDFTIEPNDIVIVPDDIFERAMRQLKVKPVDKTPQLTPEAQSLSAPSDEALFLEAMASLSTEAPKSEQEPTTRVKLAKRELLRSTRSWIFTGRRRMKRSMPLRALSLTPLPTGCPA